MIASAPEWVSRRGEADVVTALARGVHWVSMRHAVRRLGAAETATDALRAERHLFVAMAPLLRSPGGGIVTSARKAWVQERDGYRCFKCGEVGTHHVDHLFPRTLGGSSQAWNLATLCARCNCLKGHALHVWALLLMLDQARAAAGAVDA